MRAEVVGLAIGTLILVPLIGAPCAFTAAACVFGFARVFTFIVYGRWFA